MGFRAYVADVHRRIQRRFRPYVIGCEPASCGGHPPGTWLPWHCSSARPLSLSVTWRPSGKSLRAVVYARHDLYPAPSSSMQNVRRNSRRNRWWLRAPTPMSRRGRSSRRISHLGCRMVAVTGSGVASSPRSPEPSRSTPREQGHAGGASNRMGLLFDA